MGHFQVFFFFPAYVHAQGLRNTIKRLPHYFHVTSRKFFRLCISHPFLAFFLSQSPGFFLGGCISILLSALGWWLIQTVWVVSELMSLTSKCMSARILGPSLSETWNNYLILQVRKQGPGSWNDKVGSRNQGFQRRNQIRRKVHLLFKTLNPSDWVQWTKNNYIKISLWNFFDLVCKVWKSFMFLKIKMWNSLT